MAQESSEAMIRLPLRRKNYIQLGAVCLTISVACYGLALSTLISPILEKYDGMEYVSLFSLLGSIGITIMTPIGGKLGDIFGRKAVVVIGGIACLIFGIGIAFAPNLPILLICRIGVGIAQGAFMAVPYIVVGMINDKRDVPKAMGLLATALSIGGFGGSIIAGILTDLGYLTAAILFPGIPLVIGILLIAIHYPQDKNAEHGKLDIPGIILLTIALSGILFPLNLGENLGWTNPFIYGGFVLGIVFTVLFIVWEKKVREPIIPVMMFAQKKYLAFVFLSFLSFFYRGAMDVYSPLGAIHIMGASTAVAGALQLPRTIVMMFLPVLAGAWVGKQKGNMWKAMGIAMALTGLPILGMGFVHPGTTVFFYFAALTITGIGESFRGVSITPAAQACLERKDMGVGTALVNFANSLSSSLAAAIYGVVYNRYIVADANNVELITKGVNQVFITGGIVTLAGFAFVLLVVRPLLQKEL